MLDFVAVFFTGDVLEARGELRRAERAAELAAERIGEPEEALRGEVSEAAGGQFGFDGAQLIRQMLGLSFAGGEEALRQGLTFDGAQVLDLEAELAAPGDERGFGNIELRHDGREAATRGAELHELLLRLLVFHRRRA